MQNKIYKSDTNLSGKKVVLWKTGKDDYTVGVQGTSEWYGFNNLNEANQKFSELLYSNES